MRGRVYKVVATTTILCLFDPVFATATNGWTKVAGEIEKTLHLSLKDYKDGKVEEAMERVVDAYFGIFEGEKANMEIAIRRYLSLKKATELEKGFADIRRAMANKIPISDVKKQTMGLIEGVKEAARELDRKGVRIDSQE